MSRQKIIKQIENELVKLVLLFSIIIFSTTVIMSYEYKCKCEKELEVKTICVADLNVSSGSCSKVDIKSKKLNTYLGNFKITSYCACIKCCGKTDGITATGTHATEGRTIAVDPKVIPYGSKVIINGHEYVAEDCGGAINNNHIDMYISSHSRALEYGVYYADVYLVNE